MPLSIIILLIIVIGIILGWLIGLAVYRLPRGLSCFHPASFCDYCHTPIPRKFRLPILGFLLAKGRCPVCKKSIPSHYLYIEIITPVLMLVIFWKYGLSLLFFQYAILTLACILIFFTDLFYRVIPDILTLPLIGVGIIFSFWNDLGILEALKGLALGGGVFFLIYIIYRWIAKHEGLGKGDIKFLAMIGTFLGFQLAFLTVFLSALIGVIVWLLAKHDRQFFLPFGSFIAISTFISLLAGDQIIKSYWELWS